MSIIRKIIIKEWLSFFIGSIFILYLVLSLGHILSNLLKPNSSFPMLVLGLLYETPTFMIKIVPVSCLIASLFSLNKLKSRNELTAIFAAGFSRANYLFTIAILSTVVGLILFFINAYLVPIAKHMQSVEFNLHEESTVYNNAINSGRIWFKGINYFVSYASFDPITNTLHNLDLYYFDKNNRSSEKISATSAVFQKEKTWQLNEFAHSTNLENSTFPNTIFKDTKDWILEEGVLDFKRINADISTLSIWKLYDYINILKSNQLNASEYFVIFLDKFSSAFSCLVLALLSATAIFNPNRRMSSFGKNVTFVLIFTFLYWFVYSYFMTLGQSSRIPATVATFGVPTLFVLYLFFFFIYHRKLK
jgi:lipopolysaccharide export system permease protein